MDSWKLYVPYDCHSIIKCHYLLKRFARGCFSLDADLVACVNTGYLLEFRRKCIIRTCDLTDPNAESVRPFLLYNPVKLFYVIKFPSKLVIVLREETLKVFKTFEDVFKYEIQDFESIGTPQIGVWKTDDYQKCYPSLITDFSEEFSANTNENVSVVQHEMIQELAVHVQEVNMKLDEKRKHRIKSIYSLFNKEQKVDENLQNLVPLFGKENVSQQTERTEEKPLVCTSVWQKIHNDKWVLGVNVSNVSKSSVSDVALLLRCPQDKNLSYSSVIMGCKLEKSEETRGDKAMKKYFPPVEVFKWKRIAVISKESTACVIGILEKPIFSLEHIFTISGVITYKTESSSSVGLQVTVPEFALNSLDSISVQLTPFCDASLLDVGSEKSSAKPRGASEMEGDLLAVLASSQNVSLLAENTNENFETILEEQLKFKKIKTFGAYYNKAADKPGLDGIMVWVKQVTPEDYELDIYARDHSQIFLLIHCLCSVLSMHTCFNLSQLKKQVSSSDVWNALHKEVDLFVRQVTEWSASKECEKTCDGTIVVPLGAYRAFFDKLSELEIETDTVFALANSL